MNIIPANQIKCGNTREEIINAFCGNLMDRIQKSAAKGSHDCCFDATAYYENETGKLYSTYQDKWRILGGKAYDAYKYNFDDYKEEVKQVFKKAGYIIRPTGYIGGVWQLTEDICW
jgi:hypothetical protein